MPYPGNPSLSPDVQQRIGSTFEHTLGLASGGSRREALLGCDFVLRMDPLFEPARRLQERLEAAPGPVPVDDLRVPPAAAPAAEASRAGAAPAGPPEAVVPPPLLGDLDSLGLGFDLNLADLPELPASLPADLRAGFQRLLDDRRFGELLSRAEREAAAVKADHELQHLVGLAQERLEAGPYVNRFLSAAREALAAGNAKDAERLVDKARTLDPTHPGIAELTAAKAAGGPEILPAEAGHAPPAAAAAGGNAAGHAAGEIAADTESERRIRQLLDEGQTALDLGDPQAAIDAWSRIFLIDIDHQEAAQRIEQARRIKAERERQVEEVFHDGMAQLDGGDAAGARQAFQRVLDIQPGHLAAREYLQQLDSGVVPSAGPAGARDARPGDAAAAAPAIGSTPGRSQPLRAVSSGAAAGPPPASGGAAAQDGELKEEILVPPDLADTARTGQQHRDPRSRASGRDKAQDGRARRLFLILGSAVLLLALAVGWFLVEKREQWFPNSRSEEPVVTAAPVAGNPIARARRLHAAGKTAMAVAQLRRLQPKHPSYREAQGLIAEWIAADPGLASQVPAVGAAAAAANQAGAPAAGGAGTATPSSPSSPAAGPSLPAGSPGNPGPGAAPAPGTAPGEAAPPSLLAAQRKAFLEEGTRAYGEHSYLLAAQKLEQAAKLGKLEPAEAGQLTDSRQRLAPLATQLTLFRQQDWEFALRDLWRMHESDAGNRDVVRLIVDCYYNLGVRDLQRNDPAKAIQRFTEAVTLAPQDAVLVRQLHFAQTYRDRFPDLMYHIYVKYLPIR
jgi:tetratricopeptide (TPR) repeat protein